MLGIKWPEFIAYNLMWPAERRFFPLQALISIWVWDLSGTHVYRQLRWNTRAA